MGELVEKRGWKRKEGEVKNLELVQRAYALLQERPGVRLEWIRAHDGSRWNEYADALATGYLRAALSGRYCEPPPASAIAPAGLSSGAGIAPSGASRAMPLRRRGSSRMAMAIARQRSEAESAPR